MAATDKTYRRQQTLDVVFAVSSLVMLASTIWMFVDDYNRPYKAEQRNFREIEKAIAQRQALSQIPDAEEFEAKREAFKSALAAYDSQKDELARLRADIERLRPDREEADAKFQDINAKVGSIASFYDIAMERGDTKAADAYRKQLDDLRGRLAAAKVRQDELGQDIKNLQTKIGAIDKGLTDAQSEWKKVTDKFDTQVKLAHAKQWGWGDRFRAMPILDAFASPIKIQQITNNDVPIDYNFKYVTRYDRCATCHLGIDRPAYTADALRALTQDPSKEEHDRLEKAQKLLDERVTVYNDLPRGAPGATDASRLPRGSQLTVSKVNPSVLSESRIKEYAAHPRLDLFVGAKSKHPMEKFGCSACHSGQGSATDFTLAAHTPNTQPQQKDWVKEHGWEGQHMWDFPMLPQRFVESSCVKCHHEVTDLISSENRVEAPKLLRGFNLIKENGCFGCHEIAGTKAGREIGPDLRLEPNPPLEDLSPAERTKVENDTENRPGNLRKVGPSLFRLKEKTNPEWATRWIRAPRGFRPDTKMPHFYGLANNDKEVLKHDAPEQESFPDAEVNAIAYYLFKASGDYLSAIETQHAADKNNAQTRAHDEERLQDLVAKGKDKLNAAERDELTAIRQRQKLRHEVVLKDLAPKHAGNPVEGRRLFTERGCLACHSHEGTGTAQGSKGGKDYVPAVHSEAQFGPNLSQLADKLGTSYRDKKSARVWLTQWIKDPHVHHPRSRMPVTHLTDEQAADVAAWLLAQPATDLGKEWDNLQVPEPGQDKYEDLARVYLVRLLPKSDIKKLFETGALPDVIVGDLPVEEKAFVRNYGVNKLTGLKEYVGKKAVGRLGCYACHDIPGFDSAKPIGVALNDWGKKDAARLAFENIDSFLEKHFYSVPTWAPDKEGKLPRAKVEQEDGHEVKKLPYEAFFYDDLKHHHRTGYLHQKILEPRSYDYKKILAWDDRSRMPQFRFARGHAQQGEAPEDFEGRAWQAEAEAREAVMTFILGLTAELVPEKMVNQPKGDRLMEVKGRQVLDKYNCAGCHLIRPGAYDLSVSPALTTELEGAFKRARTTGESSGFHSFPMDNHWTGRNPAQPDRLLVPGVQARLIRDEDDPEAPPTVQFILAEALRFIGKDPQTKAQALYDIPASSSIFVPIKDLLPDAKGIKTQEDLERALAAQGPLGGTFANLMVPYLIKKDPEVYKEIRALADSSEARAALPPLLIGEGARTQTQWLYQFLLDPTAVRRMSILRMPKFNLSKQEAKQLVDYFAGVERLNNPGIGLTYPGDHIPQQGPLNDPFWVARNSEYLARLKSTGAKDGGSWYDERRKAYLGAWEGAAKLESAGLQLTVERAKQQKEELDTQLKTLKAKLEKADGKEKAAIEKQVGELEPTAKSMGEQLEQLQKSLKDASSEQYRQAWNRDQAYAADAYRLIVNKKLCLQCHEVGGFKSSNPTTQGPPLALVNERLRPDWVFRWIATPQRHLTYPSLMPVNFPKPQPGQKLEYQDAFVGGPLEQVEAVRDVLLNYPRISALPVNQQWNPNLQAAPTEEKKK